MSDFKSKINSHVHPQQNHNSISSHGNLNLSVPGSTRGSYSSSYTSPGHSTGITSHGGLSMTNGRSGVTGTAHVGASYSGHNHSIGASIERSGSTHSNKGSNTFTISGRSRM